MKILIWQWGRRGAGPRIAAELAAAIRALAGHDAALSLSAQSEILAGADRPQCEIPFATYANLGSLVLRILRAPTLIRPLATRIRAIRPDIAICAMPAALDLVMVAALRRAGVPYLVVVHDADLHPGDSFPIQMALQRHLMRGAAGVIALSTHVAGRLRTQGRLDGQQLIMTSIPPLVFGPPPPPPGSRGGKLRLLSFGRLLPYKGLDLLEDALRTLGPRPDLEVRIVGSGPDSPVLDALRALPGVSVENRWVPEAEVGPVLAWSDALVLSHREASQSGVAAAALAAGRWVVATRIGGMAEQLQDEALARLCDPTPESLAAALRGLLESPPAPSAPADPRAAWRDVAAALVRDIGALTPAAPTSSN